MTDELRELLHTADVPAPFLLAGHSLGGLYARHYALRFPGEVAALVLLDPAHEDHNAYMPQQLTEMRSAWDADQALPDELPGELIQFYRGLFEQEMASWPAEIREVLMERHLSRKWLQAGLQDASNVDQLYHEIRHAGPMPDLPLTILCSMETDGFKASGVGGRIRVAAARGDRRQTAPLHRPGPISSPRRYPPHRHRARHHAPPPSRHRPAGDPEPAGQVNSQAGLDVKAALGIVLGA